MQTNYFVSKGSIEKKQLTNPPQKNPSTGNVIPWDYQNTLIQRLHLQSTAQFWAPTLGVYEHNPVIYL